jgi:hypothetical protein
VVSVEAQPDAAFIQSFGQILRGLPQPTQPQD